MSEPIISYSVANDAAFRAALARARASVSDLRIPFALIARDFYRSQQAIFKLKTAGKYPDFKKGTRDEKGGVNSRYAKAKLKAVGFQYPLLVRSGKLARSFGGPGAPSNITQIEKLSLTMGTTVEYGAYHQSDEDREVIPLRKFLFIGPEAQKFATSDQMGRLERWNNILNDQVLKSLKASGAFS